jgi:ribosomal-protein-alanine N-acetyltransferase
MSALLQEMPQYRRMVAADLDAVMAIENVIYPHPWTRGNFRDSLAEGYHCWILEIAGEVVGYGVIAIAAGEVHLLNLSIAAAWQRRGYGRGMLGFLTSIAREFDAARMFLEVRPSNAAGRVLYESAGFREIGRRRGYYPDGGRPEDAVVMELKLA